MPAHRTSAQTRGSKPDKIIRDALLIELNRMTTDDGQKIKKVNRIVAKLVGAGMEGKIDAIKEIFDRVEGKASQSIGIGQADDLKPLETILRPPMTREAWLKAHNG